ncbi:lipase [Nocardia vulneris]|uniref:Lipase n=1 Tax=Nocardia vulneris TaxID=1141657 RepID=A0ABR4ZDQ5_9NOCA|nr:lipase [Nocardia vulneris]
MFVTALAATLASCCVALDAHADPGAPTVTQEELQRFADTIAAALPSADSAPAVDTGTGARRSVSDTIGYGPEQSSFVAAFGFGVLHPDAAPPGTNDWSCKPTAAHPEPVVLVHGTWGNAYNDFAGMSQPLASAGHCVFAFDYGAADVAHGGLGASLPGRYGVGDIAESADQLATFVDRVRASSGAQQVNVVAFSQGAPLSRWYVKYGGGQQKVHHLISLAGTNHGTTASGILSLARTITTLGVDAIGPTRIILGQAVIQQTIGSEFLGRLNADGDTVPRVDYTVIGTRYDEVSTPYQLTFLQPGPDARVRNITLQDGCEQDLSDHLNLSYSPRAQSIVLNALDPVGTPGWQCTFNPWLVGGSGKL